MKIKLSEIQQRALAELSRRGQSCSHELGVGVHTLRALAAKGLARSVNDIGHVAMPRACPYRITQLGRDALEKLKESSDHGDR